MIVIPAKPHFRGKQGMPARESREAPDPANRFGMPRIPVLAVHEDGRESMEFAVFAQQALAIQVPRRDIPDPHGRYTKTDAGIVEN